MPLHNGGHGYGSVTKVVHWVTVALISAQFVVGYRMEADDEALDLAEQRLDELEEGCSGDGDAAEAAEERCDALLEQREEELDRQEDDVVGDAWSGLFSGDGFTDGLSLPEWHVLLGLSIIAVALLRVLWRARSGLPPWSPALGVRERRLEAFLEKVLLGLLFVVPGSGLVLVAGIGPVGLHVAAHIAFFVTLGLHVGLVLWHTVVRRDRHLSRML
ncbi:cytochrome b [Pseudonocardia saturnea]